MTPWWISDNGSGHSTVYNVHTGAIQLTVTVPGAGGQQGTPTGVVFNGGSGFVVTAGTGTGPARFIFASEDGIISAFRAVGSPVVTVVDNSPSGAVYKGIAIDSATNGTLLYATNFHAGTVDVFDTHFDPVTLAGAFSDPDLPAGLRTVRDPESRRRHLRDLRAAGCRQARRRGRPGAWFRERLRHLRPPAPSRRVQGQLNSPWGLALAPVRFRALQRRSPRGQFRRRSHPRLRPLEAHGQGEFQHRGPLHSAAGAPIEIDGLWALSFGKGAPNNGPTSTLFFTAGPFDEQHGLFGSLVAVSPQDRHR
jgi:hypothetical protein